MKPALLILVLAGALSLHAQVALPAIETYNYDRTARDPFISARAPTTLLNERVEIVGVASEELMRRFLAALSASIKSQLSVGGVSVADRQQDCIALIDGVAFRPGDTIPLEVDQKTLNELDQLGQSFGLVLTVTNEHSISLEVGRISEEGVDCMLPGFKASICQLPLQRDEAANAVKLERKPREKKP
jgi:hypothetical protein